MATPDQTEKLLIWDPGELTRLMGDNPPVRRRLLEKFLLKAQVQVETISYAVAVADVAKVGSVAHALKSSSRTVGIMQFGELCLALEKAGKAGDVAACKILAENLNREFTLAAEKIRQSLD